jgi:hypothetical protein
MDNLVDSEPDSDSAERRKRGRKKNLKKGGKKRRKKQPASHHDQRTESAEAKAEAAAASRIRIKARADARFRAANGEVLAAVAAGDVDALRAALASAASAPGEGTLEEEEVLREVAVAGSSLGSSGRQALHVALATRAPCSSRAPHQPPGTQAAATAATAAANANANAVVPAMVAALLGACNTQN